jgi:PhzF family phenazine biosynthesis protein
MRIPYYQVNAFTRNPFGGNPAGVCPLEKWLPDSALQQIAAENDFAETAFFTREKDHFHLRWFTPAIEMDLCGHATLATAFVLFSEPQRGGMDSVPQQIRFHTRSGWLATTKRGDRIELDFPSRPPEASPAPKELIQGLGREPRQVLRSRDFLAVFDSQAEVAALTPDTTLLGQVDALGVIATAPGDDADFVSRFFAPRAGVPEDPVTGSSHSTLIPYWAGRLKKKEMFARQISRRGGELFCRLDGERVGIAGDAVIYCRGEIEV